MIRAVFVFAFTASVNLQWKISQALRRQSGDRVEGTDQQARGTAATLRGIEFAWQQRGFVERKVNSAAESITNSITRQTPSRAIRQLVQRPIRLSVH
jgi:hypothetical protein